MPLTAGELFDELDTRLGEHDDPDSVTLTVQTPNGTFTVETVLGSTGDTEFVLEAK